MTESTARRGGLSWFAQQCGRDPGSVTKWKRAGAPAPILKILEQMEVEAAVRLKQKYIGEIRQLLGTRADWFFTT